MGNVQGGKLVDTTTPEGVRAMDEQLQKKFSKGIQYNMKVVIRGDRNTGKTCLFYRMQGKAFTTVYVPTEEIQVAHIHYTYPGTNDKAKIEIWDVVDKGKAQKKGRGGLKMFNDPSPKDASQQPLDAEFLNVYQGAHGVVMLFDVTKQWTWQYIEREIPKVPLHIPVLILGNFMDIGMHRVISKEDAIFTLQHLDRPEGAADMRYSEASLKNSFGLRYLHKFLSVPFLQMQQEVLLQQLKVNREQILMTREELDNSTLDYDEFVAEAKKMAEERRRKEAEIQEQVVHQPPKQTTVQKKPVSTASPRPKHDVPPDDAIHNGSSPQSHQVSITEPEVPLREKLTSKLSNLWSSKEKDADKPPTPKLPPSKKKRQAPAVGSVDDFVPEGELDDQFFDEEGEGGGGAAGRNENSDSDRDLNPLVAVDEDLSSPEEYEEPQPQQPLPEQDDEEEEEDEEEEDVATPVTQTNPIVPLKATPQLKNAWDVELTDSEEDERPVVMADEDLPGGALSTKSPLQVGGSPLSSGVKADPAIKKTKPTSGGSLLMEHHVPVASKKAASSFSENSSGHVKHSHKEKKTRKGSNVSEDDGSIHKAGSKKTKKSKEKKDSAHQSQPLPAQAHTPAQDSDPFGLGSLDAWLEGNEPRSTAVSTHTVTNKLLSNSTKNDQEDDEEEESVVRKHKKHRRHKEDGSERHSRKKHKSKKRHAQVEEEDDHT